VTDAFALKLQSFISYARYVMLPAAVSEIHRCCCSTCVFGIADPDYRQDDGSRGGSGAKDIPMTDDFALKLQPFISYARYVMLLAAVSEVHRCFSTHVFWNCRS